MYVRGQLRDKTKHSQLISSIRHEVPNDHVKNLALFTKQGIKISKKGIKISKKSESIKLFKLGNLSTQQEKGVSQD
jgi:hypothetical protein